MRAPIAKEVEKIDESNVRMLHRRKMEEEFTGTIKVESEKITGSITYLEGTPIYARTEDDLEGWKAIEKLREYEGLGVSIHTSTREQVRIFQIYVDYIDDNGLVRSEEKEIQEEEETEEEKTEEEKTEEEDKKKQGISGFFSGILGS